MEYTTPFKAANSSRMPDGVLVQPRVPKLPDYSDLPKYWLGENALITHAMNVFSIFIPDGEKFFIQSVKYYENDVKDPELKALVKAFVQQEAQHYKAHEILNDAIKATGVDVDPILERARKILLRFEKYLPRKLQLSMTVALEHVTATAAEIILKVPDYQEQMHPKMLDFWAWHAIEEIEHKSVAYDVYKEMGGGYLLRLTGAVVAIGFLIGPVVLSTIKLLRDDGLFLDKQTRKHAVKLLRSRRAGGIALRNIKEYINPRFHPWKHDSEREEIEKWIQQFPASSPV